VCYTDAMNDTETKKLDQIIVILADIVATFGDRFDKIGNQLTGLDNKIMGVDRRLDAETMRRNDLKIRRRVHDLEEEVYGRGRSKHPRHLPL
jgi:hypothetical protein